VFPSVSERGTSVRGCRRPDARWPVSGFGVVRVSCCLASVQSLLKQLSAPSAGLARYDVKPFLQVLGLSDGLARS